jgi:uncharacterized 2Fe-2S/4Fe-4S cluster protein (DUF4445 family)
MKITAYRGSEIVAAGDANIGDTALAALSKLGVFLDAPCGGRGKCGKCKIRLTPDGEQVRACQTIVSDETAPTGELVIYLPDVMKMEIAGDETSPAADKPARSENLGVAIDIGTTTVVAHLTDLDTGARIATASGVNAQRPYGADVISRIEYSAAHGHETLTRLIQEQINGLISTTCAKSGADSKNITSVVIAGNTIMQHLAAGYSPVGMGTVPFRPVSMFGEWLPAWSGMPASPSAQIYYCPCVSSYVGGDITAGMLACDLEHDPGPTVFIDIGTNGEIAMKVGDKYLCCATAAGPAFEGAEMSCGMAAITGAINHVNWHESGLTFSVIGDEPSEGLCGSGLLDALALLLETGAVDETGRMLDADEIEHPISEYIGIAEAGEDAGKNVFFLSREHNVYLSSKDVRKLQLAKSAIASGIQTLLISAGLTNADVRRFVLAGGFGNYMDKTSAARIGLFPREFLDITQSMGNTAGEGAAIALVDAERRAHLELIDDKCEYIELSTSLIFNDQFVENMMFEE